MASKDTIDVDWKSPPFDQVANIQPLGPNRSGRDSVAHARHHLYVGRDTDSRTRVLVKLTAKPGLIYQRDLENEIASLSTINRELPESRHFPFLQSHGQLSDGRVYLIMSFFDEFPLATAIATEWMPSKTVSYLRTAMEVATALIALHRLKIFHVDLNPMNILHRMEKDRPVIKIVDFESSYELSRHSTGAFYSPPTTPRYSAPEVSRQPPDARADLFSLGAVVYTMLGGYRWTSDADLDSTISSDRQLDPELKRILLTAVDTDPDRRYRSVEQFQGVLAAYLERIWPGRTW